MRIWILSDLHIGADGMELEIPEADVCVCAGDVTDPVLGSMRWLSQCIGYHMPVIFVAGNHEFYGDSVAHGRAMAHAHPVDGVHLLDDSSVVLDGVRFVGATLWTDYALYAAGKVDREADLEIGHSMDIAERLLADHYAVRVGDGGGLVRRWTPNDARAMHQRSRTYIEEALATLFEGPTVVVTHHAPHPRSVSPEYHESLLNPAFVSDLTPVIETGRPDLWVHGHVHSSHDYRVSDTRVVCNPGGYSHERSDWDPGLVVELDRHSGGGSR